jgi:hypothetical protein
MLTGPLRLVDYWLTPVSHRAVCRTRPTSPGLGWFTVTVWVHLNDAHSVVVFGGLPEYSHAATISRLDGPAATASQMGNGENPRPSGRSAGRGRRRGSGAV